MQSRNPESNKPSGANSRHAGRGRFVSSGLAAEAFTGYDGCSALRRLYQGRAGIRSGRHTDRYAGHLGNKQDCQVLGWRDLAHPYSRRCGEGV